MPTTEFWIIVEDASLTRFPHHKTTPGETVEHFLRKLNELAENCDFQNKEETLIRDVFITNLINPGIQKELREQTLEPSQLLELAINMVLGIRNQHQIEQRNKTVIPASLNTIRYPPRSRSSNWSFSNNVRKRGNRSPLNVSILLIVGEVGSLITRTNALQKAK